jgi:MFS family permease
LPLAETVPSAEGQLSERAVILTTSLGHAICHMGELVFSGVLVTVMHDLDLERDQVAVLPMLGYLLMGVGAIPVGLWADAWGPTPVLRAYLLATAAACVGVALAPTAPLLIVALTVLGLALSIYHPAGLALLSRGVRARGRALGINGVAGSIGIATGPLLGMVAANLGAWRLAYLVVAGLALVSAAIFWTATRRQRSQGQRTKDEDQTKHDSAPCPSSLVLRRSSLSGWRWYVPQTILLSVMMLAGLNYRCLMMALPTFLTGADAPEAAPGQADSIVFFTLLAGTLGQYGGGWAADRFGARVVYPLAIGALVPLAIGIICLQGSPLLLGLAVGLLTIFLFSQQPMENSLLAETTSAGRQGLSYGTKLALTFGVGALGAQVTGLIWQETGSLGNVFYFIAACAALMTMLALAALASWRRSISEPEALATVVRR